MIRLKKITVILKYCNKNLAGFVSPNVAGSNEMVILLHCGHVLCKDCIIKQGMKVHDKVNLSIRLS